MRPYSIAKVSDREGNVLEENRPEPKEAIRADTAYVMTNLLRGVVQRGTGAKAASLNWPARKAAEMMSSVAMCSSVDLSPRLLATAASASSGAY